MTEIISALINSNLQGKQKLVCRQVIVVQYSGCSIKSALKQRNAQFVPLNCDNPSPVNQHNNHPCKSNNCWKYDSEYIIEFYYSWPG